MFPTTPTIDAATYRSAGLGSFSVTRAGLVSHARPDLKVYSQCCRCLIQRDAAAFGATLATGQGFFSWLRLFLCCQNLTRVSAGWLEGRRYPNDMAVAWKGILWPRDQDLGTG
jgi:hypothetical protein